MTSNRCAFHLITSISQFESFIKIAMNSNIIAIDTEFTRTRTYYPMLSTIQICLNSGEVFILDALCKIDISEIMTILSNPLITKIIHSCKQDIEAIYYYFKCMPKNFIDTQILAKECKMGLQCSYAALVNHFTGVVLDKTNQYSNWSKRPLCTSKLNYICNDVLFLFTIYRNLLDDLKNHEIEMDKLGMCFFNLTNEENYKYNPKRAWKNFKKRYRFDKMTTDILKKIVTFRENIAISRNYLSKFVISDSDIIKIATQKPKDLLHLKSICKLNKYIDCEKIVKIVNEFN